MSSLLQNVLASRLAQATLGSRGSGEDGSNSSDSAHDSGLASGSTDSSAGHEDGWERLDRPSPGDASDEELIGVMSAPGTAPGTPHISRPSSPGGTLSKVGQTRRSGLSRGGLSPSGAATPSSLRKSKTDPLRAIPREVSQRIFLKLPVPALVALSQVNRRYRRSATLNYCWYRLCTAGSMEEDYQGVGSDNGGATWTRRASKTDWKTQYAKQRRMEAREQRRLESLPGSGTATPSRSQRLRDEGVKTASESRQEEWNAQREAEEVGFSKNEMRDWYKAQGGTKGGKLKGKRQKGGAKAGADNASLWE